MFGLNEISWGTFLLVAGLALTSWFLAVLFFFCNAQRNQRETLFEVQAINEPTVSPQSVSASDFPSHVDTVYSEPFLALDNPNEAAGEEPDGKALELFQNGSPGALKALLATIYYQPI